MEYHMKRALLLVALLPMMAFANEQKPNYQLTCSPPTQPVQKQYIQDYSLRNYGFAYVRMDGLEVYSTMQCEVIKIDSVQK